MSNESFKLTYSTMFDPPPALHERFEAALARVKAGLGAEHPMWIDGRARVAAATFESRSPIDRDWLLGRFARGSANSTFATTCSSAPRPRRRCAQRASRRSRRTGRRESSSP